MAKDWQVLTKLTGGAEVQVERVRLVDSGVALEGPFELPPLARLSSEDQTFVAAFVRCHGSIKEMERLFGVSYPTIKNRLNRIGGELPFAELAPPVEPEPTPVRELLGRLERGELSAAEVLAKLREKEPS